MRIAYFTDNFFPEISGISDSVITTGEELRRRGHEVVYVAPRYALRDYGPVHRADPRQKLPTIRLPSLPFPNSPTGHARIALPVGASLGPLRRFKPDIIHTQSPYGTGLEAVLASRVLKVPLVGTNHTPLTEFVHYVPGGRLLEKPILAFDRWYYNRCVFVTAPYQGLIDEMRARGFARPGRAQANPVPFSPTPKSPEEKRVCKVDMELPGPIILSSGRLAPEKHVDVLLRAFVKVREAIPEATLIVTGHGSAEHALKELARELGIDPYTRFVGFVASEELEQLYCVTDVYAVVSTAETQSLSLMQAYANGVPAVVARSRGLVDYTPEGCGYLVEPGDVEGVAARLLELLADEGLRHRMGQAGAAFVERLSVAAIASEWERIYEAINKGQSVG